MNASETADLPPLPHNLRILQAAWFCGDLIAISTEDGITPSLPFIMRDGQREWSRLMVH